MGMLVWNFASGGLTSVGQDEIVILLELEEEETLPPRDIFTLIQSVYEQVGHYSECCRAPHAHLPLFGGSRFSYFVAVAAGVIAKILIKIQIF